MMTPNNEALNTVDPYRQLPDGWRFWAEEDQPRPRILFVGNSITIHGVKPEIGWERFCGMAASDAAHDYVHLLVERLRAQRPGLSYALCQVNDWERGYWLGDAPLERVREAANLRADLIIVRAGENTPESCLDEHPGYQHSIEHLMDFLNPDGGARFVVTNQFWPNARKDAAFEAAARAKGATFVSINDLGARDDMMAKGLFWHEGVAAHPGDKGMAAIADRLYAAALANLAPCPAR